MGQREKDLLLQALESPLGIVVASQEPDRDFMRLSQERTKDKFFKPLSIRRGKPEAPEEIWIVKRRAEARAQARALEAAAEGDDFITNSRSASDGKA